MHIPLKASKETFFCWVTDANVSRFPALPLLATSACEQFHGFFYFPFPANNKHVGALLPPTGNK